MRHRASGLVPLFTPIEKKGDAEVNVSLTRPVFSPCVGGVGIQTLGLQFQVDGSLAFARARDNAELFS